MLVRLVLRFVFALEAVLDLLLSSVLWLVGGWWHIYVLCKIHG